MQSTAAGALDRFPESQLATPQEAGKGELPIFSKNADGNTVVLPNPCVYSAVTVI